MRHKGPHSRHMPQCISSVSPAHSGGGKSVGHHESRLSHLNHRALCICFRAFLKCKIVWFCSQMKSPGMTTNVDGRSKTLYMPSVPDIEKRTKENLKKTLKGKEIKEKTRIAKTNMFCAVAEMRFVVECLNTCFKMSIVLIKMVAIVRVRSTFHSPKQGWPLETDSP